MKKRKKETQMTAQKLIASVKSICFSLLITGGASCGTSQDKKASDYSAEIRELSDHEYLDNPDKSIEHQLTETFSLSSVTIENNGENFNLVFFPDNKNSDTLVLTNVNLLEFMPTVPNYVRGNEYLTEITLINQEWNRQQVKFGLGEFTFNGLNQESKLTKRVDLARNCLNSYLWEIITYAEQDSSLAPVYHGWFEFPKTLYQELFNKRNSLNFSDYASRLENWQDPVSKHIDFEVLRTVKSDTVVSFKTINHELYPIVGERAKKKINVIYPVNYSKIEDFLTDSTLFATFSPPGFYNTNDPRKTKLGLLAQLTEVIVSDVISAHAEKKSLTELKLKFTSDNKKSETVLVIGGVDQNEIPILSTENAYKGYQMPMGIGNHSFYEKYEKCIGNSGLENPYYSLIIDEDGRFLDSHDVGIDGPLLHFDEEDNSKLHVWLLSFERHVFVGHYIVDLT